MTTERQPPTPGEPAGGEFDPAQLRSALKAFRKRLKMARLDDESRLGHGAMTGGGRSGIVAIVPPSQFPRAVWDELARQGKLRRAGQGMYELAEGD
ncbi:MAG TPA: hypothetical protein PKC49_07125 [Phycisphaerae bacterium]|nr:hypothetical protein [Phycisphaerae bacterium]